MSYKSIEVAQIVAISNNRCIGKNNNLPWSLPDDLKHFKKMTTNEVYGDIKGIVIMGRKTFESMGCKLLPKRANFIITSQEDYAAQKGISSHTSAHVVQSLTDALSKAYEIAIDSGSTTIWIIGGQRLFQESIRYTDRIELTCVDTNIEDGEAFYPPIPSNFNITETSEPVIDGASGLSFSFCSYFKEPVSPNH